MLDSKFVSIIKDEAPADQDSGSSELKAMVEMVNKYQPLASRIEKKLKALREQQAYAYMEIILRIDSKNNLYDTEIHNVPVHLKQSVSDLISES